jgi:hypothetical protein
MSAANPLSDSALHPTNEASDDDVAESSLPTQPWHPPPARGSLHSIEEIDFDFHDTIPAPPWLDEPSDALGVPPPATS